MSHGETRPPFDVAAVNEYNSSPYPDGNNLTFRERTRQGNVRTQTSVYCAANDTLFQCAQSMAPKKVRASARVHYVRLAALTHHGAARSRTGGRVQVGGRSFNHRRPDTPISLVERNDPFQEIGDYT